MVCLDINLIEGEACSKPSIHMFSSGRVTVQGALSVNVMIKTRNIYSVPLHAATLISEPLTFSST